MQEIKNRHSISKNKGAVWYPFFEWIPLPVGGLLASTMARLGNDYTGTCLFGVKNFAGPADADIHQWGKPEPIRLLEHPTLYLPDYAGFDDGKRPEPI